MKRKRHFKRLVASSLVITMVINNLIPAMGYMTPKTGFKTVAGNNGVAIVEDESWEERFPNGTFVFKDNHTYIDEDHEEIYKKVTIYRLGGRTGDAVAHVALTPAVAAMNEDMTQFNYANAASNLDYTIEVEDPYEEDFESLSTASNSTIKKTKATYTELELNLEDPYETTMFEVQFAEGEWVKDIRIRAVDDDQHEPEEFSLLTIFDAEGAEYNDAANRFTICVKDNEETLTSEMGFEVADILFDQSEGNALLKIRRTGGTQYVSQVSYYTEAIDAIPGTDYIDKKDMAAFSGGIEEVEIEIELVNSGIVSHDEKSFMVTLTDPKAGTLDETKTNIEVKIYNSGTGNHKNIASMIYTPDVDDLTSLAQISEDSVTGAEKQLEIQMVEEPEDTLIEATYMSESEGSAVKKGRSVTDSNRIAKIVEFAQGSLTGGWTYSTGIMEGYIPNVGKVPTITAGDKTAGVTQTLQIDGLYELYRRMDVKASLTAGRENFLFDKERYNLAILFLGKNGPWGIEGDSPYVTEENGKKHNLQNPSTRSTINSYLDSFIASSLFNVTPVEYQTEPRFPTADETINTNSKVATVIGAHISEVEKGSAIETDLKQISLYNMRKEFETRTTYNEYKQYNSLTSGVVRRLGSYPVPGGVDLSSLKLYRYDFVENPTVVLQTADNEKIKNEKTLVDNLMPTVSMVQSESGIFLGKLFVGSTLNIGSTSRPTTYTYHAGTLPFLQDTITGKTMNSAYSYTDTSGKQEVRLALRENQAGKLGPVKHDVKYEIPVILDRKQTINMNYSSSVDYDDDKNVTLDEINKRKDDLTNKLKKATITYKYWYKSKWNTFTNVNDTTWIANGDKTLTLSDPLVNVQSINFNLEPTDVIVFNKQRYAGNATIDIPVSTYENENLTFLFYAKEFLAREIPMEIVSIDQVQTYIDYNGNGTLDIKLNQNGQYELVDVNGVKDIFKENLSSGSYAIEELSPVTIDNKPYQQLLFIRYTMLPRCLNVPPNARENDACTIEPGFVTTVTTEKEKAKLTPQLREYRLIDGGDTMSQLMYTEKAMSGNVAFPLGGDFNPPTFESTKKSYSWTPDWKGKLIRPFLMPEEIKLENTVMLDERYPVATKKEEINNYLGSIHGDDTYVLTINARETGKPNSEQRLEHTTVGTITTIPSMGAFTMSQDPSPEMSAPTDATGETSKASNLSNSSPNFNFPTIDLPIGPASLVMDGDRVGFSIGIPLFSMESTNRQVEKGSNLPNSVEKPTTSNEGWSKAKYGNPVTESKDTVNKMKSAIGTGGSDGNVFKQLKSAANGNFGNKQSTGTHNSNYVKPTGNEKTAGFSIAVNMTFMWKYSKMTNSFEFEQAAFFLSAGGQVKTTVRFHPVPIIYVYVIFGAEMNLSLGVSVEEFLIDGQRVTDVKFDGVTLKPSMFIEAGVGIGIEIAKLELFLKFTVMIQASFAKDGKDAEFEKFITTGALGFRAVFLFINYQQDIVGYTTGYDISRYKENKKPWFFQWQVIGVDNKNKSRSAMANIGEYNEVGVKILWPQNNFYKQHIYSPEENLPNERARAFDVDDMPFQVGGYDSSVSAFRLADQLNAGGNYRIITSGEDNYILYIKTENKLPGEDETVSSMHASTLVLSKVQSVETTLRSGETAEGMGLKYPYKNGSSQENYLIIDDDATGDLDVTVYEKDGKLSITWTSYGEVNEEAIASASNAGKAMIALSQNTEVKTTVVDVSSDVDADELEKERVIHVVTPVATTSNAGYRFLPRQANEEITIYAEAVAYSDEDKKALEELYKDYYDKRAEGNDEGTGDPYAELGNAYNQDLISLMGETSNIHIAVRDTEGTDIVDNVMGLPTNSGTVDFIAVSQVTEERTFIAAYATTIREFDPLTELTLEVKNLYLQKNKVGEDGILEEIGTFKKVKTLGKSESDSSQSGVYSNSSLEEAHESPYFANLNFLTGKLNNTDEEEFFLFGMNGNTYIIDSDNLDTVFGDGSLEIKPFFQAEKQINEDGEESVVTETRSDVMIGVDSEGSIVAVYTDTVPNTSNNALYITTYDNNTSNWGAGTMLAMNHMQVYEDSLTYGWSNEITREAYYQRTEDANGNGQLEESEDLYANGKIDKIPGGMDQLIFASPQIAFGKKSTEANSNESTLLVMTQGTLTNLTRGSFENIDGETIKEVIPKQDGEGYMDSSIGYYAISYGIGQQKVGEAKLAFGDKIFTAGSRITPFINFKNAGDVSIRGSEANPIKVTLWATDNEIINEEGKEAEYKNGSVNHQLAEWNITTNIKAGQLVDTRNASNAIEGEVGGSYKTTKPLPMGIETMTLYFTVSEDGTYVQNPFSYSSLGTKNGTGSWKVGSYAELSYGYLKISADGHTTVEIAKTRKTPEKTIAANVDMEVHNTGTQKAEGLKVLVEYTQNEVDEATGKLIYKPIEQTGTLDAGLEFDVTVPENARKARSANPPGVFTLVNHKGIPVTELNANKGIQITGTLELPERYYTVKGTAKAMNLRVTLLTDTPEYSVLNNHLTKSLDAVSLFTLPTKLNLTKGNAATIPVKVDTTRIEKPNITVSEIAVNDNERCISSISYKENTSDSGIMTVVAKKEGSGIIRIADTTTASFKDIAFAVTAQGINISTDNSFFEFTDGKSENGTKKPWVDVVEWLEIEKKPYMNDTCLGYKDGSFTFKTFANNIDLYFKGTIGVSSKNGFGYTTTEYTSGDFFEPVLINFKNTGLEEHEVTVTLKSSEGYFDKYVEFYSDRGYVGEDVTNKELDDKLANSKDTVKPRIVYGRNLDGLKGQIKEGTVLEIPVYIMDDKNLSSVTINNKAADFLIGDRMYQTTLSISSNEVIEIIAIDGSGNEMFETREIDVFDKTGTVTESPWPRISEIKILDQSGSEVENGIRGNAYLGFDLEADTGVDVTISRWKFEGGYQEEEVGIATPTNATNNRNISTSFVSENTLMYSGYYGITAKSQGYESSEVCYIELVSEGPDISLGRSNQDNAQLFYSVQTGQKTSMLESIKIWTSSDGTQKGKELVNKTFTTEDYSNGTISLTGSNDNHAFYMIEAKDNTGTAKTVFDNRAYLSEITSNIKGASFTPTFAPGIFGYQLSIPANTTQIPIISAKKERSDASVSIIQATSSNATKIMVEEGDRSREYTVILKLMSTCTCNINSVTLSDNSYEITAQETVLERKIVPVVNQTVCAFPLHKEIQTEIRYEMLQGNDIASLEADGTLHMTESGEIKVKVTASKEIDGVEKSADTVVTYNVLKKYNVTLEIPELMYSDSSRNKTVDSGDHFTADVTLNQGFQFEGWTDHMGTIISTENPYTFAVKKNTKLTALIKDIENPNVTVKIQDSTWNSMINRVSFGLLAKESVNVSIAAEDNHILDSLEYMMVEQEMDYSFSGPWKPYKDILRVDPDSKFMIYAKAQDRAGNVTVVNSDGVILDTTSPTMTMLNPTGDMERRGKLPFTVKVKVEDFGAGVDRVFFSTDELEPQNGDLKMENGIGSLVLQNDGTYNVTITAMDKLGNQSEETVVVILYKPSSQSSSSSTRPSFIKPITFGTWVKNDTGWWYQYNGGSWPKSQWLLIEETWYYFNSEGYMVTGWIKINEIWYYLNPISDGTQGAMLLDTWIGEYYVDKNGAWIPEQKKAK